MKTILFICTGNVCRSPMAEGLMREALGNNPHYRIASAGIGALDGQPVTPESEQAMAEIGLNIANHLSQSLRVPLVEAADFIFTMTRQQQDTIQTFYPMAAEKTFLLREFEDAEVIGKDVSDPIGQSLDVYRRTRDQIKQALPSILEFIKGTEVHRESPPPRQVTRVAIAADHGGVELKEALKDWLVQHGYQFSDFGTHSAEAVDYPDYAFLVAREIAAGNFDRGVLICKSGIGMSMAANRVIGARAAVINNEAWAKLSREHNDANIIVLSALETEVDHARSILEVWLKTEFEGGRHERRVKKMDNPPTTTMKRPSPLEQADAEIFAAIQHEKQRQQDNIELIAS
jgi:RpiB/LacA/LacB family sugar-phosphate isomerase